MRTTLGDFAYPHYKARASASGRAAAVFLTALLFGVFAFLFSQRGFWAIPGQVLVSETIIRLMPEQNRILYIRQPDPVSLHLLAPRGEAMAPPSFTVASEAAAPATLSPSAAKTSSLYGGAPAATGAQALSSNGTSGNGAGGAPAACFDAAWMQAVSSRVQRFFYYPDYQLEHHIHGVAMVHILVRHNGYVDLIEIGQSSGDTILDAAARNIVRTALPLPEIPERMHTAKADVLLPVDFGNIGPAKPAVGSCGG